MGTTIAGSEAEALLRLDQLRTRFDRLWRERVRAEGDVERLERELQEAREAALALLGTSDEAEIAALIRAAEAEAAREVEAFALLLADIEADLAALGPER